MKNELDIVRDYLNKKGYSYEEKYDIVYKTQEFMLVYNYQNAFGEKKSGWIVLYAKKRNGGKFMLVIEEINSSCRHSVVCAYGQTFCTTNGYRIGHEEELEESELIPMIEKNLKKYCIKKICDD